MCLYTSLTQEAFDLQGFAFYLQMTLGIIWGLEWKLKVTQSLEPVQHNVKCIIKYNQCLHFRLPKSGTAMETPGRTTPARDGYIRRGSYKTSPNWHFPCWDGLNKDNGAGGNTYFST